MNGAMRQCSLPAPHTNMGQPMARTCSVLVAGRGDHSNAGIDELLRGIVQRSAARATEAHVDHTPPPVALDMLRHPVHAWKGSFRRGCDLSVCLAQVFEPAVA